MAFDPSLSCPIMKGITCAEGSCAFWDSALLKCTMIKSPTQSYNELTGSQTVGAGEVEKDLGQVYKDVTVYVDWDTRVKFTQDTNPSVDLLVYNGRVGIPVLFNDINARYVYMTALDKTINYLIAGNG